MRSYCAKVQAAQFVVVAPAVRFDFEGFQEFYLGSREVAAFVERQRKLAQGRGREWCETRRELEALQRKVQLA